MGAKELKDLENNPGPINNVKGIPQAKQKGIKNLKGKGPLTLILFLLLGGGALFLSGQSILGPHISNLYTKATDVQFTSYSLRNQRLFKFMMDGGDQIKQTPFTKKFTTFTPYMKSRLSQNNIEVGHLDSSGNFQSGDLLAGQSRTLRYTPDPTKPDITEIISANDFQAKYAADANFREAYYKAKRGRVAGFFDDASETIYKKLGLSRNIFEDYKATGNADQDAANFKNTMDPHLAGVDIDANTVGHVNDDNGTPDDTSDDYLRPVKNGEDLNATNIAGDTPEVKARSFTDGLISKVSSQGGTICAALRVANMANIAAFAASTANSINYFMGLTENISKMMNGEGDASAINTTLNAFTTSTTSEVPVTGEDGQTAKKTVTGSMLESNGSRLILGGIIPTKYELGSYSLESITTSAKRTILVHGGATITCSGVQAASAIVSLMSTGIPGGALAKWVVGMLAETVGGIVTTVALSSIISFIIPTLARTVFSNVLDTYTGIPAGELFSQGAAAANGKVAQSASAYTPASKTAINAAARTTQTVLAQEAEIDRKNRSPFDTSSSNTFLGSLTASLIPILGSSTLTTPLSTIGSLTGKALGSLIPTTSALDTTIDTTYTTTYGDCPALEEIGTKGDIYCNPIMTPDLTTIDIAPDDPLYERTLMYGRHDGPNLTPDGTTIIDNSNLARFITFCANRESPFGVTDANILNALQSDYGILLNSLPFLNDVIDLINAAEDAANQGWATGKFCTNTEDNPHWDEFKYYQRFVEDSRILGQMDPEEEISQNSVLAFQEKYYAEHPLDNTPQGYLARITGMTKTDIAFIEELQNYENFLSTYNPQNLLPTPAGAKEEPTKLAISKPTINPEQGITQTHILYTPTRNRSFAA